MFDRGNIWHDIFIIPGSQVQALYYTNWDQDANDPQVKAVFDEYNIVERILAEVS